MKRINAASFKKSLQTKQDTILGLAKSVIQNSFDAEPNFQKTIYEGKEVSLDCYIEWESESSLSFTIKSKNPDIDLTKILNEKERGVGSKGISPTGALFLFKKRIIEGFQKIGFRRKQKR